MTYGTMAKGNTTIDGVPCSFDQTTGIGADCQWIEIDGVKYWYEAENARDWKDAARRSMILQVMHGTGWIQ